MPYAAMEIIFNGNKSFQKYWEAAVAVFANITIGYSPLIMEYAIHYSGKRFKENVSFVVIDGKQCLALCPLFIENVKKAHRVAKYLQKADILLTGYFIYGFPGETVNMMMETVEVAKSLELDWAEMIIAAPLVGSTMLQQFYDKKILDSKKMEDVMNNADFRKRLSDTPEISAGDLEQFVYNANINVNFFNNSNMRHGRFARAISAFSGIISRYPFHIVGLACRAYCYKQIGEEELCSDDLHSIELQKERHSEAMCLYSVYGKEIDDLITKSSIISQVQ